VAMEKGIQPTRGEWFRLEPLSAMKLIWRLNPYQKKRYFCSLMDQLVQGPNKPSRAH
jgi:hypothetical protein